MYKEIEIEKEIEELPDSTEEIYRILDDYPVLPFEEIIVFFEQKALGISAEEELAKSNGDLSDIAKTSLNETIIKGSQASNSIVLHNLRLIIGKADFLSKVTNIPFPDLFNEGVTGLIEAVNRFEIERGWQFSTYAVWWINLVIDDYVRKNKGFIALPKILQTKRYQYNKAVKELENQNGEELNEEAIILKTGLTRKKILEIRAIPDLIAYSLDTAVNGNDGNSLFEEIVEDIGIDIEGSAINKETLASALLQIPAREALIISLYYGLGRNRPALESFRLVGKVVSLTCERCRQIYHSGIAQLKKVLKNQ